MTEVPVFAPAFPAKGGTNCRASFHHFLLWFLVLVVLVLGSKVPVLPRQIDLSLISTLKVCKRIKENLSIHLTVRQHWQNEGEKRRKRKISIRALLLEEMSL